MSEKHDDKDLEMFEQLMLLMDSGARETNRHTTTQREFFNTKNAAIRLAALLVVAILVTTFASIDLSKQITTKANHENEGSGGFPGIHHAEDIDQVYDSGSSRHLRQKLFRTSNTNVNYYFDIDSFLSIEKKTGRIMTNKCQHFHNVFIRRTFLNSGEVSETKICPSFEALYTSESPKSALFTYANNEQVTLIQNNDQSWTLSGDYLTRDLGEECDVEEDCDQCLDCKSNVCAVRDTVVTCSTNSDCGIGLACESNVCLVNAGGSCSSGVECASPSICVEDLLAEDGSKICGCELGSTNGCDGELGYCGATNGMNGWCQCQKHDDCKNPEHVCSNPWCTPDIPYSCATQAEHDAHCTTTTTTAMPPKF